MAPVASSLNLAWEKAQAWLGDSRSHPNSGMHRTASAVRPQCSENKRDSLRVVSLRHAVSGVSALGSKSTLGSELDIEQSLSPRAIVAADVWAGVMGHEPSELLRRASGSFRCISLDRVTQDAFRQGGDSSGSLYDMSEAADLGEVDAFISHSWHDPPDLKWKALQTWRRDFKLYNKEREPRVWIDKYCVDQNNIAETLDALPVFLAGCVKLVVIAGATYHQRLWCLAELFTFVAVGGQEDEVDLLPLPGAPSNWGAVDVRTADCVNPSDRERLLTMMEEKKGGRCLTETVQSLFEGVHRLPTSSPFPSNLSTLSQGVHLLSSSSPSNHSGQSPGPFDFEEPPNVPDCLAARFAVRRLPSVRPALPASCGNGAERLSSKATPERVKL